MSSIPVWYGVVSLVVPAGAVLVGYLLSGRNEEARDRRTTEREQSVKQLERDTTRDVWAQAFQRDLLLDLQDQLQALLRVVSKEIMADERTLAASGRLSQLPPGLSDEAFAVNIAVTRLIARILDDDLRQAVTEFHSTCTALSMDAVLSGVSDVDDLKARLQASRAQLVLTYEAMTAALGPALRRELGGASQT